MIESFGAAGSVGSPASPPTWNGVCAVEPDERGNHLTPDQYRSWGSVRATVITFIVIGLILGGIVAWLIISGHPLAGSGRY